MAGIYIPHKNLPENCFQCPAHEWFDFGGENHGYQCPLLRTTKCISNCEARTKRRDNCPVAPVPDHGDLIDRDAIGREFERICDQYDAGIISEMTCLNMLLVALHSAETVIPADKEEDE